MPDGRPIFGEDSPYDIKEHLDSIIGMTCCENGRFGDGHECMKQPMGDAAISNDAEGSGVTLSATDASAATTSPATMEDARKGEETHAKKPEGFGVNYLSELSDACNIRSSATPQEVERVARAICCKEFRNGDYRECNGCMAWIDHINSAEAAIAAMPKKKVSLEECVKSIQQLGREGSADDIAKAVLDAAGAEYE